MKTWNVTEVSTVSRIDLLHGEVAVSIPVPPGLHDQVHQGVLLAVCAQAQHQPQGRLQLSLRDLPVTVNIQSGQLFGRDLSVSINIQPAQDPAPDILRKNQNIWSNFNFNFATLTLL